MASKTLFSFAVLLIILGLSSSAVGINLTQLFNSRVYKAELMERPVQGAPYLDHFGIRVTLADGSRWLVHRKSDYDYNSQTVVVDARYMNSDWKVISTRYYGGSKTVSDFVKTGGTWFP